MRAYRLCLWGNLCVPLALIVFLLCNRPVSVCSQADPPLAPTKTHRAVPDDAGNFHLMMVPRSGKWAKVRATHLSLHPTCAACGGTEHLTVHHIRPFHLYPDLELDPANLITVCEGEHCNCHLVFCHLGSWAAWNPLAKEDCARHLAEVSSRCTKKEDVERFERRFHLAIAP